MTLAGHTGDCVRRRRSTRRPSTILAHRAARAYPVAVPFPVSPPFHPHPRARAELGRAESPSLVAPATARLPATIHRAPSCATSPRSSSIPPRTRPCPTPAEIELRPPLAIADHHQAPPRASPLSSTTTFRPSSAPNRSPVSFPAACSSSSTCSPP